MTALPALISINMPVGLAGVLMDKAELQRAHKLCEQAGVWLIVDNTYENFTYDGREHTCISGPHVINVFSMSKVIVCCAPNRHLSESGSTSCQCCI